MRVYHYLDARWGLDDIKRRRLKISRIDDTNDPFEFACVRSDDEESQRALDQFAKGWVSDYRLHCFSRSWTNVIMWSHYADKHRGLCLGFDVISDCARDVKYVKQVMIVGKLHQSMKSENDEVLEHLLGAKYDGWSYEEEVRLTGRAVNMIDDEGLHFVPFGDYLCLKEVIAGARFSMGRSVIDEALSGYAGVDVIKACCSPTFFSIVADPAGFGS
jgi:hypothetical protein